RLVIILIVLLLISFSAY
ncbi:TPA: type I toxin-antitoxin system toxin IbsC, partial [Escherichia coli]|nr:type I toxin-antitoxin system toxin IbsC [Escherichia coli]HCB7675140.1 type I toxin-antitoxin system toxin IbsC [Escherichia coli]